MSRVNLSRLKSGCAPLLIDHSNCVDYQIGVIEDAWTAEDCAFARVRFAKTAKATECWEMVLDKVLSHVSMGCDIAYPKDAPEDLCITGPWTPYEISIVPLPADWIAEVVIGKRPKAVIEAAADQVAANASGSADTWQNWAATVALPATREDLAAAVEAEMKRLGAEAREGFLRDYEKLWAPRGSANEPGVADTP